MLALALGGTAVGAATQQLPGLEPLPAPVTELSADGTSVTDGVRTLYVSQAYDLDPSGQTIQVSGEGYEEFKGIYVAFCLIPPTNQQPTPCGGGNAMDGSTGASQWVSSNPPEYGVDLAIPYGPGGSFSVTLDVSPMIGSTVDCRRVSCAVVTRNDHVRSSDRTQDMLVPVTFASGSAAAEEPVVDAGPEAPQQAAPGAAPTDPAAPVEEAATTTLPPTTTTSTPTFELESASGETGGGSGSPLPWILGGTLGALALLGGGTWLVMSRKGPAAGS